jgi:hypothetical protein
LPQDHPRQESDESTAPGGSDDRTQVPVEFDGPVRQTGNEYDVVERQALSLLESADGRSRLLGLARSLKPTAHKLLDTVMTGPP